MSQTTKGCSWWPRGWWDAGKTRIPQRGAWDRGKLGWHGAGLGRLTHGRTGTQGIQGHHRRHPAGATRRARQRGGVLHPSCQDVAGVRDTPSSRACPFPLSPKPANPPKVDRTDSLTTRTNTPKSHPTVEENDTQPKAGRSRGLRKGGSGASEQRFRARSFRSPTPRARKGGHGVWQRRREGRRSTWETRKRKM